MSTITERTRLPLGLVLTLIGMGAGGLGTYAVNHYRLGKQEERTAEVRAELAKRLDALEARQTTAETAAHAVEIRLVRFDLAIAALEGTLREVRDELRQSRSVRTARGRGD